MNKLLLCLAMMLLPFKCLAQSHHYSFSNANSLKQDTVTFNTNIDKVQYCLGNYYQQRRTGLIVTILGSSVTAVSALAMNNATDAQRGLMFVGGFVGIGGMVLTLDADKWLKKASISITPTSFVINF